MSILNLDYQGGSGTPPRNKRTVKIWVGIGFIAAVLGIGSTLASTITLNNGNATEFGQGVSASIFCGGSQQSVQVIPVSYYNNAAVGQDPSFVVGQVKVTGIPEACAGVDFSLSLYDNIGTLAPISMAANVSSVNVWYANNCPISTNITLSCSDQNAGTNAHGALIWYLDPSGTVTSASNDVSTDVHVVSDVSLGTFTLTLPSDTPIDASGLGKIVIETQADQNGFAFWNNGVIPSVPLN